MRREAAPRDRRSERTNKIFAKFGRRVRGRARGAAGEDGRNARARAVERISMSVVVLNSAREAGADQPRRLLNRHAFGSL